MGKAIQLTINNEPYKMEVKEFRGQRVVTFQDIDKLHRRVEGTAKRNFNENRLRLVEGTDFFAVPRNELGTNFVPNSSDRGNPDIKIILFTESGYLMLVKSFTDELAWQVQRELVHGYFRGRETIQALSISMSHILREVKASAELYRLSGKSKQEAFCLAVLRVQEHLGVDLSDFLPPEPQPGERTELDRIIENLIAYAKGPTIRPLPSQPSLPEPPEGWHGFWKNGCIVVLYPQLLPESLVLTLEIKHELARAKALVTQRTNRFTCVIKDPFAHTVRRAYVVCVDRG